ncbi:MAG: CPBP family intramembrane metalloprotease [Thiotrichaceae bacterium]|nr:CPBP family intramembrane metalloprotease [Thiotrichaceae bacterium]
MNIYDIGWIQASGNILLLGIVLSIVFLRYKSLVACIMIHSTNNLISLISLITV